MQTEGGYALFFTHGMSLREWRQLGLYQREAAYNSRLSARVGPALLVTYDTDLPEEVPEFRSEVAWNSRGLPRAIYGLAAPFIHRERIRRAKVLKTNQLRGSWVAVLAKYLSCRPLVVRCGYVWSRYDEKGLRRWMALAMERLAFWASDAIFVATAGDAVYVASTHRCDPAKIHVVPNAVDTDLFRPSTEEPASRVICFVGRFERQKQPLLMADAAALLPAWRVLAAGKGSLEPSLRSHRAASRIEFVGNIPNRDLAALLNRCSVFLVTSLWEGHPKAILEAMACGVPIVAVDAPGVRDIIRHRENGLLCGPDPEVIAAAIAEIDRDMDLRDRLRRRARQDVLERYSMDKVAEIESGHLLRLIEGCA